MGRLFNEKGITLVELLAAIALLGIIGVLAFRLLTGMFTANSITQNDISLKQEANIILTSIREKAQEEEIIINIIDDESLLANKEDILRKDGLIITYFHAENRKNGEVLDEKKWQEEEDSFLFTSEVSETLAINMTITTADRSSNYEISSVVPGLEDPNRSFTIETPTEDNSDNSGEEGNDNSPPPSNVIFTNKEQFEALDPDNISGWVEDHPDQSNGYTLPENTILDESFDQNYSGETAFQKSFWAKRDNMSVNNQDISINGNMYIDHQPYFMNNNTLNVGGNALIKENFTATNTLTFSAFNTYFMKDLEITNGTKINTDGSIRIGGSATLKTGNDEIRTKGYLFVDGNVNLQNANSLVEAERDMYLNNKVTLNQSSITSGGTMYLQGPVYLNNGASLISEGDINIVGNAEVEYGGKAYICAKGTVNIEGNVDDNIEIKDNGNSYNSCK
ncbi:PulJ/GspJ family protein [Salimicrobium flavidum]|uniref:Prepilin-type N-terminal cleavage/methylation domain-containing protein n=1 Tax=Salimicrobium flavidum TaxID=570947 RepID=A0A1N7JN00_9BACI|nr:prepilin-type N-terminal cleavage/methylation domain-containing protein [Salimicrobium flavidum]SIS50742.1 hypothetical protein SAMN05421687_10716 [Salimicrobium flavidum]